MTEEQKRAEAYASLKAHIEVLMADASKLALEKLDTLQKSGADIVGHHLENNGEWAAPKDFICAFAREMERLWTRPNPTRADKARVTNYFRMM